jgi:excisionase family DNA binding protein
MLSDTRSYLTIREVADTLAVALKTVYQLVWQGKIRAVRVGRSVRIPSEALQEYLDGNAIAPPRRPAPKPAPMPKRARVRGRPYGVSWFPP